MSQIYETKNFIVEAHEQSFLPRTDGGHIRIKVKDASIEGVGLFFNEREIWRCSLGVNVDIEMDGKNSFFERPVVILKKINHQSAWILPITSSPKDNVYMYPLRTIPSFVSISQMRVISAKRLLRKETRISVEEYAQIIIRIKYLLTTHDETSPNRIERLGDESRSPKA